MYKFRDTDLSSIVFSYHASTSKKTNFDFQTLVLKFCDFFFFLFILSNIKDTKVSVHKA